MSTVNPGDVTPVAAAPVLNAPTPEPAKPAVPEGHVPVAALQDERTKRQEREAELDTLRQQRELEAAELELIGVRRGADGRFVSRPIQSQAPSPDEPPAAFVDAYNTGDVSGMWRVMREQMGREVTARGGQYVQPLLGTVAEGHKERVLRDDPWLKPHMGEYDKIADRRLNEAGIQSQSDRAYIRALPQFQADVTRELRDTYRDTYVEYRKNPGTVVGRFTEGAAPGNGPVTPSLSPEAATWAKDVQGVSDEVLARAAEIKAQREGRR